MSGRVSGDRGGNRWPAFPQQRGTKLLSRLLGPFPFDPPSFTAPVLTLGLILFPSWAGAPGVGHRAPGVTNACPRPGLPPPPLEAALNSLSRACVSRSVPGNTGWGRGSPWPLWKHSRAHVGTLLSDIHAHVCSMTPCTHIHTDTVIRTDSIVCSHPDAQLDTSTHSHTYAHTQADPQPHVRSAHTHTPQYTYTLQRRHMLNTHVHTATHIRTLTHTPTHMHTYLLYIPHSDVGQTQAPT